MKRYVLLSVWMLSSLCVLGQVTFKAKVFLPGGRSVSGMWASLMMIVEGEDTARFAPRLGDVDTLGGSVCFTGIARGARCYLSLDEPGMKGYDYPAFTINEDMDVDSLVLKQMEGHPRLYWCRALRDSALRADVAALGGDPMARDTHCYDYGDGHKDCWTEDEPHALKLARIYYSDWVLPIASWRTFPHAADSAYRYALMAYDRKKGPWLYSALCQLHRHLGLGGEPKVRKPETPRTMYLPNPYDDAMLSDSTVDLMTSAKYGQWLRNFMGRVLPEFGEPSLCCPVATEGTLRYMAWSPWGYVSVLRLQGRRVYVNKASGWPTDKMKLEVSDEFDLDNSELAEVRRLMEDFLAAKYPDDMTGTYVIDGGDYMLEYILDGEYRTFRVSDGGEPQEFEALTIYLWSLYRARHE